MTDTPFSDIDRQHLLRALELAARGLGRVEPNPMVGAIVADGPRILAHGYHARFGGPHAEVVALEEAGAAARGATLYVTLEPCCHFGKTPPCTEAVITAGIRRVVAAMTDPFAEVAGRGFELLRAAGIAVEVGLMETEARRLNAPFIKLQTRRRPYVIAKWAMTLDGRLATPTGDAKWISCEESRQWVHTLRSRVDGIVVGSGTVLKDNPLLTVRLPDGATNYGRRPARVVLDQGLRTPLDSQLVATAAEAPVIIATTLPASDSRAEALASRGVTVLTLPASASQPPAAVPAAVGELPPAVPGGGVDIGALLDELARRGMTNLLVEGGRQVLSSFFHAGEVDALAVFVAPKLVGGAPAHVAPGPPGFELMSQAAALLRPTYTSIGVDLLIRGVLRDY